MLGFREENPTSDNYEVDDSRHLYGKSDRVFGCDRLESAGVRHSGKSLKFVRPHLSELKKFVSGGEE